MQAFTVPAYRGRPEYGWWNRPDFQGLGGSRFKCNPSLIKMSLRWSPAGAAWCRRSLGTTPWVAPRSTGWETHQMVLVNLRPYYYSIFKGQSSADGPRRCLLRGHPGGDFAFIWSMPLYFCNMQHSMYRSPSRSSSAWTRRTSSSRRSCNKAATFSQISS